MKTIEARIPDTLYEKASCFAADQKTPLDQIVTRALTQALDAWTAQGTVAQRAVRADREKFLAVLDKVPDLEPPEEDRWP